MKHTGTNTAINTIVVEIHAAVTSCIAPLTALFTEDCLLSSLAITASTTTMASSTTVPMASTKAKSVSRFNEKPASVTRAKVPTRDTIMEIEGMIVALRSCRNTYTTSITSMIAITSVSTTLCMEASRKSSDVSSSLNSNPAGRRSLISLSTSRISAFTFVALAPGACLM